MFITQARITDLLNTYIGRAHIYGVTDCNLILAKYIDTLTESDYYGNLFEQYTDIKSGIKAAKSIGFISAKNVLEKVAEKVEQPINGDILLQEHKSGRSKYYSTSIVWGNKALVEKDNYYSLVDLEDIEFAEIYRIRK